MVRYLFVSNIASPEAVEYPDTSQLSVMAMTNSQHGKPLWDMRDLPTTDDDDPSGHARAQGISAS